MELNIPLKYQKDIETAVDFLKSEGCQSVYLFGSLVTGDIHDSSDIDIGIKGLPVGNFIRVYAKLDNKVVNDVDLVDFDAQDKFFELLNSIGEVVKIG
ncbi:MAG: nucleotidyltransferase domain-containing protein [Candidatus Cloacimonetes bacterium]|nr:nucleotidyltransferase domain-containing protein [Candidatus Cloacimonadota bacterium]